MSITMGDTITLKADLRVQRLYPTSVLPRQADPTDAGWDLSALYGYTIRPGQREIIQTGIAVAVPDGAVGYIKPRSGLAAKHGIDVLAGVIDSGYRGEIRVVLLNTGENEFKIQQGDRIAQLVIQPIVQVTLDVVKDLGATDRGEGGFGSTGVN